jgi:hypothetical protein
VEIYTDKFGREWMRHEGDPRPAAWVRASEIAVDVNVQRTLKPAKLARMRKEGLRYEKVEAITVSQRPDGQLTAVEGQYRTTIAKDEPGDPWLLVTLVPDLTVAEEARIANEISSGRTRHTPLDQWKLALEAGDEYITAADVVLTELGLTVGAGKYTRNIAAVAAVMRTVRSQSAPADGAKLLWATLDMVDGVPESADRKPGARWDATIINAVARVLQAEDIDPKRLRAKLTAHNVQYWLSFSPRVEQELRRVYNSGKKSRFI